MGDVNARNEIAFNGGPDLAGETWAPLDLGPYLSGEHVPEEPGCGMARDDGLRMLYRGREHAVIGEMESGKSWFALACVAAELTGEHRVIYVHFEESDPLGTVERLRALGVPNDTIKASFAFVAPNEPVDPYALAALLDPAPTLVVLDGINEALSLHGLSARDESDVATLRRRLIKPSTAVGAAVLGCDHVVADREARGRKALGSVHKGNAVDGTIIMLENVAPFGRGERGCSHVFVTKDRPGFLRRHGRAGKLPGKTYIGSLIVDDTREWVGWLDLAFISPPDQDETGERKTRDEQDDDHVYEVVVAIIESGVQPTLRTVRAKAGIGKDRVGDALTRCVLDGRLTERPGPNRSRLFGVAGAIPIGGGS